MRAVKSRKRRERNCKKRHSVQYIVDGLPDAADDALRLLLVDVCRKREERARAIQFEKRQKGRKG
jgi:hypothetical protein